MATKEKRMLLQYFLKSERITKNPNKILNRRHGRINTNFLLYVTKNEDIFLFKKETKQIPTKLLQTLTQNIDRSYSDCQQMPPRRNVNNNPSPLTARRNHVNPIFGTPTRV